MNAFAALSDDTRREIVRLVATSGVLTATEISGNFEMSAPAVSQHLKVLKDTGFVQGEIDGPRVCYCIDPETVKRFQKLVAGLPAK